MESIELALDKLYSDIGIQKALNYLVVVGDTKTYDHLVQLKNDFSRKAEIAFTIYRRLACFEKLSVDAYANLSEYRCIFSIKVF